MVQHYFNSSGDWIAFRPHPSDRYLFDRNGNWIGWFPWNDNEIVDLDGRYLGTVIDEDRIYRAKTPKSDGREPGFVVRPGRVGYAGYPGYAAHCAPPYGFADVVLKPASTRLRLSVSSRRKTPPSRPSRVHLWMSKIGLGRMAPWIERMILPTRKPPETAGAAMSHKKAPLR